MGAALKPWPRTFGAERIVLIEDLSKLTGYPPQDLVRALRGWSVYEVQGLLYSDPKSRGRQSLDRLVEVRRGRD